MSAADPTAARVADRCQAVGLPITAEGVATVSRYLDEERAGDRQSNGLAGQVQGVAVHGQLGTQTGARHHVR